MMLPVTRRHLARVAPHLIPAGFSGVVLYVEAKAIVRPIYSRRTSPQVIPGQGLPGRAARGHKAWPIWARLIRSRRTVEDRGVGDTLERTVGLFGSEDFRFWFYCVFGASKRPCPACPAKWNRAFPYGPLTVG